MAQDRAVGRDILPIPDRPYEGLFTYDAKDHLISPGERLRIAMARQ